MNTFTQIRRIILFKFLFFAFLDVQYGAAQTHTFQVEFEMVTDNAASGNGGNAWGGHQCRIVRTAEGVFTAYTVDGPTELEKNWKLVHKTQAGWEVIAEGVAGREPVNITAGPDGTLYVVGWPKGRARLWTITKWLGVWTSTDVYINGQAKGDWPYQSAGIDLAGNLCVLSSEGGDDDRPGGDFYWSYFDTGQQTWTVNNSDLPYRYCYTYVFPHVTGGISMVSVRDVTWATLDYTRPDGHFNYVFNAFRYWHAESSSGPLNPMAFMEEPPTQDFPYVVCNSQKDAYIDTRGNVHVLYWKVGETTGGEIEHRHVVFTPAGDTVYDGFLPGGAGWYSRIFQDSNERYFLLGDKGWIFLLAENGYTVADSAFFDLQGYKVEYSGYGLAVPRTGTPRGSTMDVVFPTNDGREWIYFTIPLDALFKGTAVATNQSVVPDRSMLIRIYPNPFNPETKITYTLSEDATVTLRIMDLTGRVVTQMLQDELQRAGYHSCFWHGEDANGQAVSSGTYLLVLEAGLERQIRKVTLLK